MKEYNPKKALQLLKEAGYKGEPITVLSATDHNTITPATQVLIQAMREAGINVDVAVDGLGLGRLAPRQEGAAGPGRLEHLRHHVGRRRLGQSGAAHLDRRGLRQGPVRLAVRSPRSRSCATPSAWPQTEEERKKIAKELQTTRDGAGRLHSVRPVGHAARLSRRQDRRHRAQHRSGGAVGHHEEIIVVSTSSRSRSRARTALPDRGKAVVMTAYIVRRLFADPAGHGGGGAVRLLPAALRAGRSGGDHRRRGRHGRGDRRRPRQARPRPADGRAVRRLGAAACCRATSASRSSPTCR